MNSLSLFRFALKNNLPVLQHVSLPRVGALQTIVDTVGPEKNTNIGGNNNGDPTMNFDGRYFVWNLNICNVENIIEVSILFCLL
jgi:lysophosphatidylglycerol acyltransferase 1